MRTPGKIAPALALIAVTAVWGSTFFLIKDLVKTVPPLDFLGVRFVIAAAVIAVFQFGKLRRAGRVTWLRGAMLGAVYSVAQLLQTAGLQHTDASVSGFITGMYVVFTPVLMAVFFRQRLGVWSWTAVAAATIGLGVLSLQGFAFGPGESLTLAGALCYAVHIVLLGRWAAQGAEPITLGLIQVVVVGVILGIAALPGGVTLPTTASMWGSLLYMALVAGLGAIVLQTWAQSRIEATTAAIIMTTEPVFAAGFAVAMGGESLTVRLIAGGALILIAMLLIEVRGGREEGIADQDSAVRSAR